MLHARSPRCALGPCARAHTAHVCAPIAAPHPLRHRPDTQHLTVVLTQHSDTSCIRPAHARSLACRSLKNEADKIMDMLDTGKNGRLDVINRFYQKPSKQVMQELLADDFKMGEEGYTRVYGKADYIGLTADRVLPAIPDFNWGHACNGIADKDGYVIVTIAANGTHSGAPLELPGLAPLPPSGRHFCLAEEAQKVKVVGGKITEIQVLPAKGAGPRALYAALGGTLPDTPATAAATSPNSVPPLP